MTSDRGRDIGCLVQIGRQRQTRSGAQDGANLRAWGPVLNGSGD